MAVQDMELIEKKIDRVAAGAIPISDGIGGVAFTSMGEVLEFAKLLSVADKAIPKHLRGNPGACLAITLQAVEWRMSPIQVANKSYEVNDRIAYEAQLIHAVVEARAPLKQRLRFAFEGEGATLVCSVTGQIKGEVDPLVYTSPPVGQIKVKNSPLWVSDPQQQLSYYSVRAWARRFCPDVLLGIYSEDELEHDRPGDYAQDVTETPSLKDRLPGKGKRSQRGFQDANVQAIEHKPGETLPQAATAGPEAVPVEVAIKGADPTDAAARVEPEPEPEPVEDAEEIARQAAAKAEAEAKQAEAIARQELEAEVAAKTKALAGCQDEDDVRAIVEGVTALIRKAGRKDLLADFLSAAKTATNKLPKGAPKELGL